MYNLTTREGREASVPAVVTNQLSYELLQAIVPVIAAQGYVDVDGPLYVNPANLAMELDPSLTRAGVYWATYRSLGSKGTLTVGRSQTLEVENVLGIRQPGEQYENVFTVANSNGAVSTVTFPTVAALLGQGDERGLQDAYYVYFSCDDDNGFPPHLLHKGIAPMMTSALANLSIDTVQLREGIGEYVERGVVRVNY
jgi:hypothetical protein